MRPTAERRARAVALEAESRRLCLIAASKCDGRRFERYVRDGLFVSPMRGLYADGETWRGLRLRDRLVRIIRTLAMKHPNWVFCGFSAALIYGLWVANQDMMPVQVAQQPPTRTRSTATIRRVKMDGLSWREVDGVRVTPLEQTVVDCLLQLDFERGLAIADSALVLGVSRGALMTELARRKSCARTEEARSAIEFADPRAENGGESVARGTMIRQGFQVPDLQREVPNVLSDGKSYRADFAWTLPDGSVVYGELDGKDKYVLPEMTGGRSTLKVLTDERLRESRMSALGARVMRFSFADVTHPAQLVKLMQLYGIPRGEAWGGGTR